MGALTVALKDVRIMFRDRRALIMLAAFPLVLFTILGLSFGTMFSGGGMTIGNFQVVVANLDTGSISGEILKGLRSNKKLSEMITLTDVKDRAAALDAVRNQRAAAALVIPAGFSNTMMSATPNIRNKKETRFEVLVDPAKDLQGSIFDSIVRGIAAQTSAQRIGPETALGVLSQAGALTFGDLMTMMARPKQGAPQAGIIGRISAGLKAIKVEVVSKDINRTKQITSFQYYGAGMAVMFLLFATTSAAKSFLEEREHHTLHRLLSAPTSKSAIVTGKLLGTAFTGFLQLSFFILFTHFIFGVDWGSSTAGVVLVGAATVFAATGLAVLVAGLSRTSTGMDVATQLVVFGMSALGGSMVPKFAMSESMRQASNYTVNGLALEGFLKLMDGQAVGSVLPYVGWLMVFAVVGVAVGAWRLRVD